MKDLDRLEVWFVTGSMELYGEEALRQVAEDARQIAAALDAAAAIPVAGHVQARAHDARGDPAALPGGQRGGGLRGAGRVDAHVLAGQDVDRGAHRPPEAAPAPAHPVQSRPALGRDRHGLHEPQPVRPRGPRVRLPGDPPAPRADDGGGALAGSRRGRPDRDLVARGLWLARGARAQDRAFRRQHARGGRHRGRQDRGADALRLLGQLVRRERPGGRGARGRRRRGRSHGRRVRRRLRDGARAAARGGSPGGPARGGPDRGRSPRIPRDRAASGPSRTPSRTSTASSSCRASPSSGSWRTATGSAPKGTGSPPRWSGS